jgi:hypothetical protein
VIYNLEVAAALTVISFAVGVISTAFFTKVLPEPKQKEKAPWLSRLDSRLIALRTRLELMLDE